MLLKFPRLNILQNIKCKKELNFYHEGNVTSNLKSQIMIFIQFHYFFLFFLLLGSILLLYIN